MEDAARRRGPFGCLGELGMMSVLLRLEGPLQSWGTRSRFNHRDTEREPSKSGSR